MHSRIFELSENPIPEDERFSQGDVPEWFLNSIADYTDDIPDDQRMSEIDWLVGMFHGLCTADGERLSFNPELKEQFFKPRYACFLEAAALLKECTYEAFWGGEGSRKLAHTLFLLNDAYEDKYGFYIYDPAEYELQTIHAWLRGADLSKKYFVGGILDFHW